LVFKKPSAMRWRCKMQRISIVESSKALFIVFVSLCRHRFVLRYTVTKYQFRQVGQVSALACVAIV